MIVFSKPGLVVSTYIYKRCLEVSHLIYWHIVQRSAGASEDDQDLFRERERAELALLQKFHQPLAAT